jgi:hypothetical protein
MSSLSVKFRFRFDKKGDIFLRDLLSSKSSISRLLGLAAFGAAAIAGTTANAQISVYINAPGDNTASDYSALTHATLRTETFDTLYSGSSKVIKTTTLDTNVGDFMLTNSSKLAIINNRYSADKAYAAS